MSTSINFPDSPTEGQEYTYSGTTYKYVSGKWVCLSEPKIDWTELDDDLSEVVSMGSGTQINWEAGIRFDKTMTGNTTFSDTNLVKGKIITKRLTGDYAPSYPAYWAERENTIEYDGTTVCTLVAECIEDASGSEEVEYYFTK